MRCRTRDTIAVAALAALALLLMAAAPPADAASVKKSIWGPAFHQGQSQFPIYADLGVGLYQYAIGWGNVAPTRPANPTDPNDPAYEWPAELDFAVGEAEKYGMKISVMLTQAPPWANGGNGYLYAPHNPADFADFAIAAARKYPSVKLWLIWGEPSVAGNFQPFSRKKGPRRYASLLDAAYGALKSVDPANLVIGGNTAARGQILPGQFIERMRLPNGRPPRLDMYGHNPFGIRKPDLKQDPRKADTADTSDLDSLLDWIDEDLRSGKRNRGVKLFISEWTMPTDHSGYLYNFWASRRTAANYLSRALRITRRMKRVYTLGWYQLYDQPPNGRKTEMNWGLLTHDGQKKPAYYAFKNG